MGIQESDKEILNRLFILFDNTGEGFINFKQFVCGCSVLCKGTVKEKLLLAFNLFDENKSGSVSKTDMRVVIGHTWAPDNGWSEDCQRRRPSPTTTTGWSSKSESPGSQEIPTFVGGLCF